MKKNKTNNKVSSYLWLMASVLALIVWVTFAINNNYPTSLAEFFGPGSVTKYYPLAAAITYLPPVLISYTVGGSLVRSLTGPRMSKLSAALGALVGTIAALVSIALIYKASFAANYIF